MVSATLSPEVRARVHFALDAGAAAAQDVALLSAAEALHASRLHTRELADTYIRAHAQLRRLLARELGEPRPARLRFEKGAFGKPRLAQAEGIHFSLSHRPGCFAIAIDAAPVGIDIEVVAGGLDFQGIASRFFTTSEQAILSLNPAARAGAEFFRLWTRKEALLKAAGLGVDAMPQADAHAGQASIRNEHGHICSYSIHDLDAPGNLRLALACSSPHLHD